MLVGKQSNIETRQRRFASRAARHEIIGQSGDLAPSGGAACTKKVLTRGSPGSRGTTPAALGVNG
jgi:hypothetical protein